MPLHEHLEGREEEQVSALRDELTALKSAQAEGELSPSEFAQRKAKVEFQIAQITKRSEDSARGADLNNRVRHQRSKDFFHG